MTRIEGAGESRIPLVKRKKARSGFNEPGEVFIFEILDRRLMVFVAAPQWRPFDTIFEETWVWETWAYFIDEDGNKIGDTLWQYSKDSDIREEHIRRDIKENFHRISQYV